ncbi:hypothetical protein NIES4101_27750 (plasmid) [Calothrix sp. NIES-4101]|nr:hypothetical protein NIES4101_27750 [Calothrix sp. NIES-4101]
MGRPINLNDLIDNDKYDLENPIKDELSYQTWERKCLFKFFILISGCLFTFCLITSFASERSYLADLFNTKNREFSNNILIAIISGIVGYWKGFKD